MKKIPTLFERKFANHKVIDISSKVTPGMEWVLEDKGDATVKYDGTCCAIIDGKFYKRYDAKRGKKPPEGAIPCCDPDPVTGHHPHWVLVDGSQPDSKWHIKARENMPGYIPDGTYEAVGPHFQSNPHNLRLDQMWPHGSDIVDVERTFEGIREYLRTHAIEGLVFWLDGEPMCKIKRSDFGFEWPVEAKNG